MVNLFIDSNRYLALFWLDKSRLEDIKTKLIKEIRDKKINLWLPEQVKNEVLKNIEIDTLPKKIADATKLIGTLKPKEEVSFPSIPEFKSEIDKVRELIINKNKEINTILTEINAKAIKKVLDEANQTKEIINEMFSVATFIPYDEKTITVAFRRFDLGLPPGKSNSRGDAVIWETLLEKIPAKEDLYFVSSDKDFNSKQYENPFSEFLSEEWKKKKGSKIIPFEQLGQFIKAKIPEIKLPDVIITEEKAANNIFLLTEESYKKLIGNIISMQSIFNQAIGSLNPITLSSNMRIFEILNSGEFPSGLASAMITNKLDPLIFPFSKGSSTKKEEKKEQEIDKK